MAVLTVRNLPDEIHRALKQRAAAHGRSVQVEVRDILKGAVLPPDRLKLGQALSALGQATGLTNADFEGLASARDGVPAEPTRF